MKIKKREQLRRLYESLPKIECKGLCWQACGPIVVSKLELKQMQSHGKTTPTTEGNEASCPYLGQDGRCATYDHRPTICRMYGVADGLDCPHGCEPERMMSRDEGKAALAAARKIGGDATMVVRDELVRIVEAKRGKR